MSAWSVLNGSAAAALVARWTALLALAWFAHRALAGRNPRWRVALWRAAVVGLAGVGLLTLAPPVLTVPVVPAAVTVVVVPSDVPPSTPRPLPSDRGPDSGRST
jgi:hypothetical protein